MTLNDKIEALCQSKGLVFRPWQYPPPWEVQDGEQCPYPANSAGLNGGPS